MIAFQLQQHQALKVYMKSHLQFVRQEVSYSIYHTAPAVTAFAGDPAVPDDTLDILSNCLEQHIANFNPLQSGTEFQTIVYVKLEFAVFHPMAGGCTGHLPPSIQNKGATCCVEGTAEASDCFK